MSGNTSRPVCAGTAISDAGSARAACAPDRRVGSCGSPRGGGTGRAGSVALRAREPDTPPGRTEQFAEDFVVAAGVVGMDHRARVGRSYFYGGVYVRSGRTADQYGNLQPPAFQLFADVDHLLERRGNQSAQADRVGAPSDGFVDDAGTLDHHAQVADRVAVAGHDYRHDVLADVVYVAFHGSHQHLASALGVRFGTLLDVGSQYGDGFFHHAGGLDHLRQEHFALPEQITYDLHGRHQQLVDHR